MSLRIHTLGVMVRCVMLHTGNKSRLCQERKARRLASIKNNLELIPSAAKREEGNFCKKGKRQNGFYVDIPLLKIKLIQGSFFIIGFIKRYCILICFSLCEFCWVPRSTLTKRSRLWIIRLIYGLWICSS